jgi:hemerythrin superfamily protein
MARSKSRKPGRRTRSTARPPRTDAVALLKADHRQVEKWFGQFKSSKSASRKNELASNICTALRTHTTIEEEIFYPAFLKAAKDKPLHHEALVEHAGAKKLIEEIAQSNASDDFFDAKVKVLSEMIKHHVKEEEQPDGMFAEARKSKMDLEEIGRKLQVRKQQLSGEGEASLLVSEGTLMALNVV